MWKMSMSITRNAHTDDDENGHEENTTIRLCVYHSSSQICSKSR